ncbi:MAG: hypothetical protein H7343_12290 [Undibacterium sp.]|nr:hypothetical protein [Opitutaceae bacterium]
MKITLDIPAEKAALLRGCAAWYGQRLDEWINDTLTSAAAADLVAAAEDQRKSPPIRQVR